MLPPSLTTTKDGQSSRPGGLPWRPFLLSAVGTFAVASALFAAWDSASTRSAASSGTQDSVTPPSLKHDAVGEGPTPDVVDDASDEPLVARPLGRLHPILASNPPTRPPDTPITKTENTDAFSNIYNKLTWSSAGGGSGKGSTLSATMRTRAVLEMLLVRLRAMSMIDVPCGAMVWMPLVLQRLPKSFIYLGLDVVPSVVESDRKKLPELHFEQLDMSVDPLPAGYDVIHCRDVLQHLPFATIIRTLENFCKSGTKYLIVTTYNSTSNANTKVGGFFPMNLFLPPFSLPTPVDLVDEETRYMLPNEPNKYYAVFALGRTCPKLNFEDMQAKARVLGGG